MDPCLLQGTSSCPTIQIIPSCPAATLLLLPYIRHCGSAPHVHMVMNQLLPWFVQLQTLSLAISDDPDQVSSYQHVRLLIGVSSLHGHFILNALASPFALQWEGGQVMHSCLILCFFGLQNK